MPETTYLTPEGLEKLQAELEDLKKHQRPETISRLETAKALGDLSENAEYHDAKDSLAFIEGRIREVELLLRDVSMINEEKKGGKISIGSTIVVEAKGVEKIYQIVGSSEAEPANGRISNESPLGSAFIGHTKGETVDVITPAGETKYEIVDVR
ncbi:MAG: transcription elongation factor GreA [Patescibacteria group bacterium]